MNLRRIGLSLLLAATMIFSACGETLEEPTSQTRETHIGSFKSLGSISVNKTITHLFETKEGEILYAYSERYDLDDSKYFDSNWEVYGMVLEYESLDKSAFNVQRINEVEEDDEPETEDMEMLDYKDTDLGFSMQYPSNWEFSALRDSVQLEAPLPEQEDENAEAPASDYIVIAQGDFNIQFEAEQTDQEKAELIHSYVSGAYPELSAERGLISSIGVDAQFAISYKPANGNVHYFAPRSGMLYEISFYHPEEEELDRLKNTNTFTRLVTSFRFLPIDGEEETPEVEEVTEEEEIIEEAPEEIEEPAAPEVTPQPEIQEESVEQFSFSSYRELESNPYGFSMSYPGNWYYFGSVGSYGFGEESFEDDSVEPTLILTIGDSIPNGELNLSRTIDGTSYHMSGPASYKEVMQTMLDSIQSIQAAE